MFPKENYQCWNAIEICSNFFKNFIKEWWSFTKKKRLCMVVVGYCPTYGL